jgi:hypothetical protein
MPRYNQGDRTFCDKSAQNGPNIAQNGINKNIFLEKLLVQIQEFKGKK